MLPFVFAKSVNYFDISKEKCNFAAEKCTIIMDNEKIPLLDCPVDYILGEASGKLLNEYGRFPCKIKCGVYAFIAKGSAYATVNITRYHFAAQDILYIEPGSFLLIHEFSEDALVRYIVFSSSFLEKNTYGMRRQLTPLQGRKPMIHMTDEQASVVMHFSDVLTEGINCTPNFLNAERMVPIFNLIQSMYFDYFMSSTNAVTQVSDRKSEIYQEYSNLVMQHYHEWHHVSQYAETMRMTMPHLCASIKAVSGRTAGDLIVDALLMDAKAQLKVTSTPIKEISMSLGFDNVAFFNRFFKTHTGCTPKVYRLN